MSGQFVVVAPQFVVLAPKAVHHAGISRGVRSGGVRPWLVEAGRDAGELRRKVVLVNIGGTVSHWLDQKPSVANVCWRVDTLMCWQGWCLLARRFRANSA